jgi:ornithine decarboxylase
MNNSFLSDTEINHLASEHGTPLLVVDCYQLKAQYSMLCSALPGVDFYYAVKAFPQPEVLKTFNQLGAGFDVASAGEIELLRSLHINPRNSIHTHPIKSRQEIQSALRFGCTTFVVDNPNELEKFKEFRHRVGLILRVSFRGADAVVDLSKKFGCQFDQAGDLLDQAKKMGIHVKGLSFHVGSQSTQPDAHVNAIFQCGQLIRDYNANQANSPIGLLDIGGGFPVSYTETVMPIEIFCVPLRDALSGLPEGVQVIAEPGRYLVAPSAASIASVVGKTEKAGKNWYYIDDGVYGNYSGIIYDYATYPIRTLKKEPGHSSVLAGPTCDSIDIISEDIALPDLDVGDLIVGEVMGAYTAATSSEFNSLKKSKVVVLNEAEEAVVVSCIA